MPSPRTARSKGARGCWRAPRTCTTSPSTADRSSMARPAVVFATPATAATRSPRRSASRRRIDYAPPFQLGIPPPSSSRAACRFAPDGLDHVFFCNSGSEAVDTALKIALAYWQMKAGQPRPPDRPRARLSWRRLWRYFRWRDRRQPQNVRRAAAGRSSAAHLRPRKAAFSRASRNRARISPTNSSGWSICTAPHHRRRDRRADGRFDRRDAAPKGISSACAKSASTRHPVDLRRGHHRLRPPRPPSRPSISASCRT